MPATWSQQLCERFHLRLPPDVAAWFDEGLWQRNDFWVPFGDPISPADLLDPGSYRVWGGQQLPDTLPLFDDDESFTCLRFRGDGTVAECVYWHRHGQWRPLGESLSEAMLYVVGPPAVAPAPPPKPAKRPWWRFWGGDPEPAQPADACFLLDWALQWVPASPETRAFRTAVEARDAQASRRYLLEAELVEVPLRRARCEALCTSRLLEHCRTHGGQGLERLVGVDWPEFASWLADTDRIPVDARRKLSATLSVPEDALFRQDWEGAAQEAEEVLELRRDLAWPFAVLGYATERRGELAAAAELYLLGVETLGTTQDFTEDWLLPDGFRPAKFGVQRLAGLRDHLEPAVLERPYLQAALLRPFQVDEYWLAGGERALAEGRPDDAYRCFYAAGWDEYCSRDGELLDRIAAAADAAGFAALREIARHHRATLG